VISGYVELMRDASSRSEREKYGDEILKQFQTLGAMQREVLAFARGETQVFSRKVLVDRYFEELLPQLRAVLTSPKVRLESEVQTKMVAYFDSERVTRALSNLVRNADEALVGRSGVITVSARADGTNLILGVSDSGPGIPDAISTRLFESFVTHGKKDGTGLGLAIVQRIAVEHGGKVELMPSDSGAHFVLTLPGAIRATGKASPEKGKPKPPTAIAQAPTKKATKKRK
jgi:signal transduction histidine kinase